MKRNVAILLVLLISYFLSSCSPVENNIKSTTQNSSNKIENKNDYYLDIMGTAYDEFVRISSELSDSAGSGEDVKDAYYGSQEIVTMLSNISVPSSLSRMKDNLVEGIDNQSTGFGCFSNKSICGGDVEAMRLIARGKFLLDDFLQEFQNF